MACKPDVAVTVSDPSAHTVRHCGRAEPCIRHAEAFASSEQPLSIHRDLASIARKPDARYGIGWKCRAAALTKRVDDVLRGRGPKEPTWLNHLWRQPARLSIPCEAQALEGSAIGRKTAQQSKEHLLAR